MNLTSLDQDLNFFWEVLEFPKSRIFHPVEGGEKWKPLAWLTLLVEELVTGLAFHVGWLISETAGCVIAGPLI